MPGTHVALLRGINVGTAKRVAMIDLKRMVEGLGFTDVRTLLNSGNVVFTAPRANAASVARRLETGLETKLKVSARIIVLSSKDFGAMLEANPLLKVAKDHSRLQVSVFASEAARTRLVPLSERNWPGEALALGVHAAFMWCPQGALESPLAQAAHKILKDEVTTRTWVTMLKLQAVLEE